MLASVKMCVNQKAKAILISAPVGGPEIVSKFENYTDEVVVLEKPLYFRAIVQVYENWYDASNREVTEIMQKWEISR